MGESGAVVPRLTSSNLLCDIPSGCCFFTGPWTVTRSSLRILRRVAAFRRPLQPVLLLVSLPRLQSPVAGVLGLCWIPLPPTQKPSSPHHPTPLDTRCTTQCPIELYATPPPALDTGCATRCPTSLCGTPPSWVPTAMDSKCTTQCPKCKLMPESLGHNLHRFGRGVCAR